ncbi:MAG: hypothetical protein ACXW6V_15845 [Candidatus Binatia bacterium]
MHTHKLKVTIPSNHQVSVTLPDDFPAGPAEVVFHTEESAQLKILKLAGVLAPNSEPSMTGVDPIAEALAELRRERRQSGDKLITEVQDREEP